MGGCRCLCNGPCFIHLPIYFFVTNIYRRKELQLLHKQNENKYIIANSTSNKARGGFKIQPDIQNGGFLEK